MIDNHEMEPDREIKKAIVTQQLRRLQAEGYNALIQIEIYQAQEVPMSELNKVMLMIRDLKHTSDNAYSAARRLKSILAELSSNEGSGSFNEAHPTNNDFEVEVGNG